VLTNIIVEANQSIDDYLHSMKTIIEALAALQSPVSNLELIQLTTAGYMMLMILLSLLSPCSQGLHPLTIYDPNCYLLRNASSIKRIVLLVFIMHLWSATGDVISFGTGFQSKQNGAAYGNRNNRNKGIVA